MNEQMYSERESQPERYINRLSATVVVLFKLLDGAVAGLFDRAQSAGIEAMVLSPRCGDFNEDLRNFDIDALRAALRIQLTPEDVGRFLSTRD